MNEPFGLVISGMAPRFTSGFEQQGPESWACEIDCLKAMGRQDTTMVRGCFFLCQPIGDATKMVVLYAKFSYPGQPERDFKIISKADNDHPSNTFSLKVSKLPQGMPVMKIGLQIEDKKTKGITFVTEFLANGGSNGGGLVQPFGGGAGPTNQAGVVKIWEHGKVVGIILSRADGREYKCHVKNVQGELPLAPNTEVVFDVGSHLGKPTAMNVRPP